MALNALTLSVTSGVQGRPFEAPISGKTAGNILSVYHESSPGFVIVNDRVRSEGLPYQVSTVAIRERNPTTGETLITRIDIQAVTRAQREAQASAAVPGYASYRIVETRLSDGTYQYQLAIKDAAGATTLVNAGKVGLSGSPGFATIGAAYSFTPAASGGQGTKVFSFTPTTGTLAGFGMSLNTSTGAITAATVSGSAGSLIGTLSVTDDSGTATLPVTIGVFAALGPTTASVPVSTATAINITGLSVGETVTATSVGTVASGSSISVNTAVNASATVTTSAGRTLGIAITAVSIPAALAYWNGADYTTTPRKMIKNRAMAGATFDANLLSAPRRLFARGAWYGKSLGVGVTLVDANATAPDGSGDASTLHTPGGVAWQLNTSPSTLTVPNGTYSICVSARLASGTGDFQLGDYFLGTTVFTATGTWQRFKRTVTVSGGSMFVIMFNAAGQPAQDIQFCDLEVFAGSADLNPNPLGAAPISVQRGDMKIGRTNFEAAAAVTGGFIINGAPSLAQLPSNLALSSFTVVYAARHAAVGSLANLQALMSDAKDYTQLTIGYDGTRLGSHYGGTATGSAFSNSAPQIYPDLWHRIGDGAFVGAESYDGTTFTTHGWGAPIQKSTATIAAPSVRDLAFGILNDAYLAGYDILAMSIHPLLTGPQIKQQQDIILADAGVTLPSMTLVGFFGTSITLGQTANSISYAYRFAASASKPVYGFNAGISGATISTISTAVNTFLTALAASPSPAGQKVVISLEVGANDLGALTTTGQVDAFSASVATLCDQIRAAGLALVLHTVTPRNDAGDGGTQFNLNRARHNTTIRGWVGTHVDAIADVAANATIGADASANDLTQYPDKIHPSLINYRDSWTPITAAALNPQL